MNRAWTTTSPTRQPANSRLASSQTNTLPVTVTPVDPVHPDPAAIARAATVLRAGGLVAFPTETVYGLGANALDATAVARIFEAKARPAWNPVIAHVLNIGEAQALTTAWPTVADKLARHFWPGPLTLVLPKHPRVPDIVSAGLPAVAVRAPRHPVARALIEALGAPIAAPSANRFTELSPTTAAHVVASLGGRVDLILDGGACDVGIESSVLDLTGQVPVLLRPGVLSRSMLQEVAGVPIALREAPAHDSTDGPVDATARLSPGMMARHYAPRADVWLFERDDADQLRRALAAATEPTGTNAARNRCAALVLDWSLSLPKDVRVIPMPNDPLVYARALYATLHTLDAEGVSVVAIEQPPVGDAWAGIRDRLNHAQH